MGVPRDGSASLHPSPRPSWTGRCVCGGCSPGPAPPVQVVFPAPSGLAGCHAHPSIQGAASLVGSREGGEHTAPAHPAQATALPYRGPTPSPDSDSFWGPVASPHLYAPAPPLPEAPTPRARPPQLGASPPPSPVGSSLRLQRGADQCGLGHQAGPLTWATNRGRWAWPSAPGLPGGSEASCQCPVVWGGRQEPFL